MAASSATSGCHWTPGAAEDRREAGALLDTHVVAAEAAGRRRMIRVTDQVGHVLDERAAAGDVEDLHPAADAEHGQARVEGLGEQGRLAVVAVVHGDLRVLTRGLAVALGVDVGSAGEDQSVQAADD
jgi:hypothetical protein